MVAFPKGKQCPLQVHAVGKLHQILVNKMMFHFVKNNQMQAKYI